MQSGTWFDIELIRHSKSLVSCLRSAFSRNLASHQRIKFLQEGNAMADERNPSGHGSEHQESQDRPKFDRQKDEKQRPGHDQHGEDQSQQRRSPDTTREDQEKERKRA
jgi:hypothetical protein